MCKRFEDFEEESKQYNQILLNYLEKDEVFVDQNFHPLKNIPEKNLTFDETNTEWKRIDEVYPAPLFKHELINIDFIKQGELGDCFFLSALSYLSTQPENVKHLFDHRAELYFGKEEDTINLKCGAVVIYFYAFGRRVPVLIDTLIPLSKVTGKPRFSKPINNTKSAWFCLVEKAFAKLNNSYTEITGGTFSQAIYSLFGFYSTNKSLSSLKSEVKCSTMKPYDRILKYLNRGSIISAGIHIEMLDGLTEDDVNKKGLIKLHSYLILSAKKVAGANLLCLKNPWGEHEWNGDWSDDSELWTSELKKEVGFCSCDDGTFWMCDTDFLTYFTEIDVSKPIPNNWHSRQFFYQLLPGPHEGYDIESEEADLTERPNFAFQVIDPIEEGKICRFHILVEKRQPQECDSEKLPYCVFLVSNSGRKLLASDLPYCRRYQMSTQSSILSFPYTVKSNDEIQTIVLYRLGKSDLIEDCYVNIFCELDFKLYNIDDPENLIQEDEGNLYENNPFVRKTADNEIEIKSEVNDEVRINGEEIIVEGEEEADVDDDKKQQNERNLILNEEEEVAYDEIKMKSEANDEVKINGKEIIVEEEEEVDVDDDKKQQNERNLILNEEEVVDNKNEIKIETNEPNTLNSNENIAAEHPTNEIENNVLNNGNDVISGEKQEVNESVTRKEVFLRGQASETNSNDAIIGNGDADNERNNELNEHENDHSLLTNQTTTSTEAKNSNDINNINTINENEFAIKALNEDGEQSNNEELTEKIIIFNKDDTSQKGDEFNENQTAHNFENSNEISNVNSQIFNNDTLGQNNTQKVETNLEDQTKIESFENPPLKKLDKTAKVKKQPMPKEENELLQMEQKPKSPHRHSRPNSHRKSSKDTKKVTDISPSKNLQQRRNAYKKMNEPFLNQIKRKPSPIKQQSLSKSQKQTSTVEESSRQRYRKSSPIRCSGSEMKAVSEKADLDQTAKKSVSTVNKKSKQQLGPKKTFTNKDIHQMFNSISDNVYLAHFTEK